MANPRHPFNENLRPNSTPSIILVLILFSHHSHLGCQLTLKGREEWISELCKMLIWKWGKLKIPWKILNHLKLKEVKPKKINDGLVDIHQGNQPWIVSFKPLQRGLDQIAPIDSRNHSKETHTHIYIYIYFFFLVCFMRNLFRSKIHQSW